MKPDLNHTAQTLTSFGKNPNLASVLLVSLGCEGVSVDLVEEGIARSGKPVKRVILGSGNGNKVLTCGLSM